MFLIFSHPSDLESVSTKTDTEAFWKGIYNFSTLPRWQPNFRDLNFGCTSQLKSSSPDIWSCIDTGDLQIKLTLRQTRLLPPKTMDQDHTLNIKLVFLPVLYLTLALAWKDNAVIHICQAIAKEETEVTSGIYFYFRQGENLTDPWLQGANGTITANESINSATQHEWFVP